MTLPYLLVREDIFYLLLLGMDIEAMPQTAMMLLSVI